MIHTIQELSGQTLSRAVYGVGKKAALAAEGNANVASTFSRRA
jgi:hypothetical protein